jgi:hypothetical protein
MSFAEFEDNIAAGFSRRVSRRRLFQRSMRLAAASAVATTAGLGFARRAEAGTCQFTSSKWGCYCASTPSCGSGKCCRTLYDTTLDACCGGAQRRCDYWTSYPYCWCSTKCCIGGGYGYYSCCDCWKYGAGSSCRTGNTKCICKGRTRLRSC